MGVEVFVPASIGNVGPGFDVLGLAVSGLGDVFKVEAVDQFSKSQIRIEGRDANKIPVDPNKNTVTLAANFLAQKIGRDIGFKVDIKRSLPVSGGLGASAASSVAGAVAAAALLDLDSQIDILEAALYAESLVAGKHLDNIAPALLGGLCVVQSLEPAIVHRAAYAGSYWYLLITPPVQLDTKKTRALLPSNLDNKQWIHQMALTASLLTGFAKADSAIIRQSLQDPFAEPKRSGFIPGFFEVKAAALQAGALGFAISGGGPSCFAVCETQALAEQIGEQAKAIFSPQTSVHVGILAERGADFR